MSEPQLCPQCGSEIPAGSPAGLCPKCLVLAGLESQKPSDPRFEPTLASPPPKSSPEAALFSVEDLAARFPQLEILELLGRGGMGAVYKARQKHLDRLVAVKILPPEVSGDPAFSERFTREARALARLNHPNIVGVYDFGKTPSPPAPLPEVEGRTESLFYFIMEYVDGVNLRQAIQSGGMDPKQALAIVPQICDALQFAHDEGIVHRDIKPENILIDKRGRVKIADFGLAKLLGQETADHGLTATQQVMGTLRYMAPEQMEGSKTVDHRADIYSLGVVFYELLTGELPIGRFAPPSKKVEIDVRLDEVVLRALEKEPEKRYQHASEVKTEVEQIRSGPAAASKGSVAAGARLAPLAIAALILVIAGPVCGILFGHLYSAIAHISGGWTWTTAGPFWSFSLVSFVTIPVMGAMAFVQIRRSGGKLYGLRMALLEAMVIPAIVVYCAVVGALFVIVWACCYFPNDIRPDSAPLVSIEALILLVAEVLVCRRLWNKLLGPPMTPDEVRALRRRQTLSAAVLVLLATATAAWYAWFPPPTYPLETRLVGAWEGSGDESVLTGPQVWMTFAANVQATFRHDLAYTWRQQNQPTLGKTTYPFPPEEAISDVVLQPWKHYPANEGDELRVILHLGEARIDFHGENEFTLTWKATGDITLGTPDSGVFEYKRPPQSPKVTGELTFHRVDRTSGASPRALAAWIFSGVAAISLALIVGLAIKGLVRRNRITARPAGGAVPVPVISDQVRAIGKISLWTAILGLIVPILLALVSILLQRS